MFLRLKVWVRTFALDLKQLRVTAVYLVPMLRTTLMWAARCLTAWDIETQQIWDLAPSTGSPWTPILWEGLAGTGRNWPQQSKDAHSSVVFAGWWEEVLLLSLQTMPSSSERSPGGCRPHAAWPEGDEISYHSGPLGWSEVMGHLAHPFCTSIAPQRQQEPGTARYYISRGSEAESQAPQRYPWFPCYDWNAFHIDDLIKHHDHEEQKLKFKTAPFYTPPVIVLWINGRKNWFKFLSERANLYLSRPLHLKWLISLQLLTKIWSHILWSGWVTLVKGSMCWFWQG